MRGLRARMDAAFVERVLARLGDSKLELDPRAQLPAFELDATELEVAEAIQLSAPSLAELLGNVTLDPDAVQRVAYALMLTRSLRTGSSARGPVHWRRDSAPPASRSASS